MNAYLGEQVLRVIVSPGRAGYLIPDRDPDAFRKAVALASSRLAGITEPILPINEEGRVVANYAQVAEHLDLAGLVNLGCDEEAAQRAGDTLALTVTDEEYLTRAFHLRSLPWYAGLAGVSSHVAARPNAALWEVSAAGVSDADETQRAWSSDDNAGRAALLGQSLLEASLGGLVEADFAHLRGGPALLWVTEPDSLQDCIAFWNYRCLRPLRWSQAAPMVLMPSHALQTWVGFEEALRQWVRNRPFSGRPDVVLNSLSVSEEILGSVVDQLGLVLDGSNEVATTSAYRALRSSDVDRPPVCVVDVDPMAWLASPRTLGYREWFRVQVFERETAVPLQPPSLSPLLESYQGAVMRWRVGGGFIDNLPKTPSTARAVNDNAAWDGQLLQMSVGVSTNGSLPIRAPSTKQVLDRAIGDLPGEMSLSDKGQLARALMERRSTAVLRDVACISAILALTTPRSTALKRTLDAMATNDNQELRAWIGSLGGRVTRTFRSIESLEPVKSRQAAMVRALEALSNAEWTERGVKVLCQECRVPSFVPLTEVTGPDRCPGCRAPATLSRTDTGVEIYYRLDAFVDRCSDQGVLPHAAVADALCSTTEMPVAMHLGTNVIWDDGSREEVDVLGFVGADLVAGEIKTSPADFTESQLRRDVALSRRLGVQSHILGYIWPTKDVAFMQLAYGLCAENALGLIVVGPDEQGMIAIRPIP